MAIAALASLTATPASAKPKSNAEVGLKLAKDGDCVSAVPILEAAEEAEHRPVTAGALAQCHLALGEILLARDLWRALAEEDRESRWSARDKAAHELAKKRVKELDARIPRIQLDVAPRPEGLKVTVAGRKIKDLDRPIDVAPDEKISIVVSAKGYRKVEQSVVVSEREIETVSIRLVKVGKGEGKGEEGDAPEDDEPEPIRPERDARPDKWIGARFRGYLAPQFYVNAFAEGGRTYFFPGAGISFYGYTGDVDLVGTLAYASYATAPAPYKPFDAPSTEWEIVESDLHSLTATLDIVGAFPLTDARDLWFRIGGGVGVGWMFAGDLLRTQAYPASGKSDDPYAYKPCRGPNNPAGTYRYCNQLDKDADRYGGPDRAWGDGGARPIFYPWVALPEVGLEWDPMPDLGFELEIALTLSGLMTGFGVKYGL